MQTYATYSISAGTADLYGGAVLFSRVNNISFIIITLNRLLDDNFFENFPPILYESTHQLVGRDIDLQESIGGLVIDPR
jgi:hypothetical protein